MKRVMFAAACLATLVACSKEQEPVQRDEHLGGEGTILATAKDFTAAGDVKTVITQSGSDAPAFAWKDGDIIGIIPMNGKTVQSNYEIAEIGSNPKKAIFDGGVWALKEGKEYAAYYPFNEQIARSGDNLDFSFLGQTQFANNSLEHLGAYDYMYASAVVPQSGSAQFDFNHKISLVCFQLTVPKADTYTKVVLESSERWFANRASLKLSDGTMIATESVKSATINLSNIEVAANGVLTVWLAILPTSAMSGQTLNVKLFGNNNTFTGEITGITSFTAGNAYSYSAILSTSGYQSFNATIATTSKSTLSPEGKISWESGDAISVNGSECTTETGGTTSVFSANIPIQPAGMVSPQFKSVFPASLETSLGKYVLPSVQPHSSSSVTVPMYAQSNDNNLTFNPTCGLICVSFSNAKSITSVQITMDKAINGEFTISTDGTAVIKSGSSTTAIDCGSGAPATDKFYISIPAGAYNSLTLEAINEKGVLLSKSTTKSLTISKGVLVNLGNFKFDDIAAPELVDLGLSVKWASFNVGASKPEEYGNYYAWGEIGTKTAYDWNTYKWCDGTYQNMTKYGTVDNRAMLEPEDDVASILLGSKWRMPSAAEIKELMANCAYEECQIGGVLGCKFTSRISGYSDRWIFIPAAGYRGPVGAEYVGVYCDIWSSSYVVYNPRYAYSAHVGDLIVDVDNRYWGYPVRAVYGDRIPVSGVSMKNETVSLTVGETFPLGAIISPSNATEQGLIWSTNDKSVVTVIEYNGKLTAVDEGTAIITVRTVDGGYTASCQVTVTSAVK